jgi:UDP-N-acetylenolpyruvoylglucosamine reductase
MMREAAKLKALVLGTGSNVLIRITNLHGNASRHVAEFKSCIANENGMILENVI